MVFADDDMYLSAKNVLRFVRQPSIYPDDGEDESPILKNEHRERSLKQQPGDNLSDNLETKRLYAGKKQIILNPFFLSISYIFLSI